MASAGARASSDIRKINQIISELENILSELPRAMSGVKTTRLEREIKDTISRYKKVRSALSRIG